MATFLEAESAIVQRIKDELAAQAILKARVLTAAELDALKDKANISPAIYVILQSYEPASDVGLYASFNQTFLIVVAVKSAKGNGDANGIREAASPLIDFVLKSLIGFKPSKAHHALKAVSGPSPEYESNCGYFPLSFQTRYVANGEK